MLNATARYIRKNLFPLCSEIRAFALSLRKKELTVLQEDFPIVSRLRYYCSTGKSEIYSLANFTMKTMIERSGATRDKMGRNLFISSGSLPTFKKFPSPLVSKSPEYRRHQALFRYPPFHKLPLRLKHYRDMSPITRSSKRSRENADSTTAAEEPPAKVMKLSKAAGM